MDIFKSFIDLREVMAVVRLEHTFRTDALIALSAKILDWLFHMDVAEMFLSFQGRGII
jgi:hypothetical protein